MLNLNLTFNKCHKMYGSLHSKKASSLTLTFVLYKMSKPHAEFMHKIILNSVMTPHYLFNHTNCLEQGTFRHTY